MAQESADSIGKSIAKEAAFGAAKAFVYHAVTVWVIPIGLPAVTIYLGYLQGLPWMYIVVGAGVMFAATSTGLVRFDEWRERRRTNGKLHFSGLRVVIATTKPGFCLGVYLKNEAAVTMEVDFTEIRTSLENLVPRKGEKGDYKKTRYIVNPHDGVFFDDYPIDVVAPRNGVLEANVDFRIKYGPIGNPKYSLRVKKRASLLFDQNGVPKGTPAVYDAA